MTDKVEQNIKQPNLLKSSVKGLQPGFFFFRHVSPLLKAENVPSSAAAVTMVNAFVYEDSFCSSVSDA